MKILVTGAFGNIGRFLVPELIKQGYSVNCLVLSKDRKKAKIKGANIFYGDIREKRDIETSIKECDVVIHLAFSDPKFCENKLKSSSKINIEGTKNLLQVVKKYNHNIKVIFPSSISVYFYELNKDSKKRNSLRYIKYIKDKLRCEELLKSQALNWSILRIGPILPTELPAIKDLLDIPLDAYFEFIYIKDAIKALINAFKKEEANKKIFLTGGGKDFRMSYKNYIKDIFKIININIPEDSCFSSKPYLTDHFVTTESQRILKYQEHKYKDFLKDMHCKAKI